MKTFINILNFKMLCSSDEVKPTVILLLAALLPALHCCFGSIEFAHQTVPAIGDFAAVIYMFSTAFVVMGLIPVVILLFVFHEKLRNFGLQWGDWRMGLLATVIFFILISGLMLYPSSQTSEMQEFYPFDKAAGETLWSFIRLEFLRGALFYTAWEFFFRGFLLFSLRKYLGDWIAICIQIIPSCLWHIGMPAGEIFASILGGFLFGIMAVRTRSIVWPFLLHWMIGIGLDGFIVLTL